ncbi:MAG: hypothetical protein D6753_00105 [Planctomycetota bacterium]|nr:MAG: hypothetical protein D6753_00105 [Planctomycetota bacterium]
MREVPILSKLTSAKIADYWTVGLVGAVGALVKMPVGCKDLRHWPGNPGRRLTGPSWFLAFVVSMKSESPLYG